MKIDERPMKIDVSRFELKGDKKQILSYLRVTKRNLKAKINANNVESHNSKIQYH